MSISISYDVFCDGDDCLDWDSNATSSGGPKSVRDRAKKHGWGRVRIDGKMRDLCPACLKKYQETKK